MYSVCGEDINYSSYISTIDDSLVYTCLPIVYIMCTIINLTT